MQPALKFVRYKNKKYNFKDPIQFEIIETPDFTQDDEEDRGEWVIENKEWGIVGADFRSLEYAIIDAEFYFHWEYGRCIDNDNSDLTVGNMRKRMGFDGTNISVKELTKRMNGIVKYRHGIHEKLIKIIGTIDDVDNMPWNDAKFFKS